MADTEFEEFRAYFESLPQHIKAPAHCYTIVHDVSPELKENSYNGNIDGEPCSSQFDSIDSECSNNSDKLITSEGFDSAYVLNKISIKSSHPSDAFLTDNKRTFTPLNLQSSCDSPPIERQRRRKLPEIPPKRPPSLKSTRELSLADELKNARPPDDSGHFDEFNSPYKEPCPRPKQIFKCSSCHFADDDCSSPESEKYSSLGHDSGHSTIHSPKCGSPQITGSLSPDSSLESGSLCCQLDLLEATHRGLYKFIPRHRDEMEIEIGDPIYVQREADDLWCEGINLRTGRQGIFPAAHVTDIDYLDFDPSAIKVKKERYILNYLGSIQTLYHKGNDVLTQAVKKISKDKEGYVMPDPHPCILEVSDQGIRMVDRRKPVKNQVAVHDYFYNLKNVSFCGFHPADQRFFGFVTKHPALHKFACHVFTSDRSTRPVAEAVG